MHDIGFLNRLIQYMIFIYVALLFEIRKAMMEHIL